jgi:hypothetical protein
MAAAAAAAAVADVVPTRAVRNFRPVWSLGMLITYFTAMHH